MADGQNKDVLQDLSDNQRKVAEAQPEPINDPEPPAPPVTTPPSAVRNVGVKREPATKQ